MADFLAYDLDVDIELSVRDLTSYATDKLAFDINEDDDDLSFGYRLHPLDPFEKREGGGGVVEVTPNVYYYQRALDSGTGGYVYWSTLNDPDPNPDSGDTSPNYTGTLSVYSIIRILTDA